MGDILAGAMRRVPLVKSPPSAAQPKSGFPPPQPFGARGIADDEGQKPLQIILGDGHLAVHIGLPQSQFGAQD